MFTIIFILLLECVGQLWCQGIFGAGLDDWLESGSGHALSVLRPYGINSTEETMQRLILEGRCYLICLKDDEMLQGTYNISLEQVWIFLTLKDDSRCPEFFSLLHECTRGCRICYEQSQFSSQHRTLQLQVNSCRNDCQKECKQSCGGESHCPISNASDVWSANSECSLQCNLRYCQQGCQHGQDIITDDFLPVSPVLPSSKPVFRILNDTDNKGLYTVHLTANTSNLFYTGILVQIKDILSSNVTYMWQHDSNNPLDLSNYAGRTVNVSLRFVHLKGETGFTEPVQLYIEEDIPDAPRDIQVSDEMDKNNFQHAVLNISWQSPKYDTNLDYYLVNILPDINCSSSETYLSQEIVHENFTTNYFILLSANGIKAVPLMGCTYFIEVAVFGNDGFNSSSVLHTVRSLTAFKDDILNTFTCEKKIAIQAGTPPTPYFIFTFNWTIANYMNDINGFSIEYRIYNIQSKQESDRLGDRNSSTPTGLINSYSTNYMHFSQPRRNPDEKFLIKLNIHWKQENTPEMGSYNCTMSSLSPAPSEVRHFQVHNFEAVSPRDVILNATWIAPLEPNGLSHYYLCWSQHPLKVENLTSEQNSSCLKIEPDEMSIYIKLEYKFFEDWDHVYFNIQPVNTYVAGSWSSSPLVIIPPVPIDILSLSISLLALSGFLILIIIVITIIIYCFRQRTNIFYKMQYTEYDKENVIPVQRVIIVGDIKFKQRVDDDSIDKFELPPTQVHVTGELGHGRFGVVMKGRLLGRIANSKVKASLRQASCVPVAIKMLRDEATGKDRSNFFAEIEILKKVCEGHHPHVVAMLGYVTTQEPLCLVTEFVEHGDLHSFLLNFNKNSQKEFRFVLKDIVNFSYQIADGMEFISSKGIAHCDLACRNILVGEGKSLKIADFGLSCEIGTTKELGFHQIPVRWMPIEFIEKRELTEYLDVWSFGVVVWEIAATGKMPYSGIHNCDLVSFLKKGNRLEKPESVSNEIYEIMQSCWREEPSKRPKFQALKNKFSEILLSQKNVNLYIVLENPTDSNVRKNLKVTKSTSSSDPNNEIDCVHLKSMSLDTDLQWTLEDKRKHGILHTSSFKDTGMNHDSSLSYQYFSTITALQSKQELEHSEKLSTNKCG